MYDCYLGKQVLVIDQNAEETTGKLVEIFKNKEGNVISIRILQDKIPGKKNEIIIPFPFKLKCGVKE